MEQSKLKKTVWAETEQLLHSVTGKAIYEQNWCQQT